MRINEVEAQVGITKKNIRFYEEQGLLLPAAAVRTATGTTVRRGNWSSCGRLSFCASWASLWRKSGKCSPGALPWGTACAATW